MTSLGAYDPVAESDSDGSDSNPVPRLDEIQLYAYRWLILALYCLINFSNSLVAMSLYTVTDDTAAYYQVPEATLTASSTASIILTVIVAIPVTFIPSKLGLRTTAIIASIANALGACINIASTRKGGFPFFVAGQVVIAFATSVLPQLAPHVSAVWFGEKEHALSTGIGLMSGPAGIAVAFLQPVLMVSNMDPKKHIDDIHKALDQLIYTQAGLCVILLVLVIFFFRKEPFLPPTLSQALRAEENSVVTFESFKNDCKVLLKDKNYLMYGNAFAISQLVTLIFAIFINPIMSWKFPHRDDVIGWMGFGGIIAGVVGSIVFSIVLDKTQSYKTMSVLLGVTSLILAIGFVETLANWEKLPVVIILFVLTCFSYVAFQPVVSDTISEMMYPITECTSLVLPLALGGLYRIPVTFLFGYLIKIRKYHIMCLILVGLIALSMILVSIPKIQRNRTEAGKKTLYEDPEKFLLRGIQGE